MKILLNTQNYNINYKQEKYSKKTEFSKKELATAATITILGGGIVCAAYLHHKNSYINDLAKDLSRELNKKITRKDLKSIVSNNEIVRLLSNLKEENFIDSVENLKDGTFIADLHSHTNYSDGTISIKEFLDQAANYGNKLNKINGKKFIVALTDHDGVNGTKEALKIIAQEPEKYKNIKFIPGAEVGFVMPSAEESERYKRYKSLVAMPEILVYGINPFSKKTEKFFNDIYKKRKEQIKIAIQEAKNLHPDINYSIEEYTQFFNPQNKFCFLNQHWKIWNYLHTKTQVANLAKEQGENSEKLYSEIAGLLRRDITPYSLNQHLITSKKIKTPQDLDSSISEMLTKKIFPTKVDDINVNTNFEIKYQDIVKFTKEENSFMAFAHPGFTMQSFLESDIMNKLQFYIKNSKGRLKFIEKFHQAYPIGKEIEANELEQYNRLIDELKLIQIGGRDNHSKKFIPDF